MSRICKCGRSLRNRGRKGRQILTAAGEIKLARGYFECVPCQQNGYPLDERLGVAGRYSHNAQRLISLAAASWSYDISSERLAEFCGLKVSDTTIRQVAQEQGAAANEWLRTEPEAVQEFREEQGEIEFTTDGTSVNTTDGWREMKVGLFSKRDRAAAASPEEWDSRTLPAPKVSVAFAAIEKSDDFGRRWKAWRKRLGLVDTSAITVLADGAKWIWEEQVKHLPNADGVLDIFHVLEHVAATGKVLHPDATTCNDWCDQAQDTLLSTGYSGLEEFVQRDLASFNEPQRTAVNGLLNYLTPHQHHLDYTPRLAAGQSIGSGQIEGACKNLIGKRLKANAARWKVRRVNRMAGLCSIMYTHHWEKYWQTT